MSDQQPTPSPRTRDYIALTLIVAGIVGITLVSAAAIWFAKSSERADTTMAVFSALLPVVGTWIGTVLAFYFAKENFQAASDATRATLKQAGTFSEDTKVAEVMTLKGNISPSRTVADMEEAEGLVLSDLTREMQDKGNHRVPVFTTSRGAPLLVIHQDHVNDYAQKNSTSVETLGAAPTVGKLREVPELKSAVENFVTVQLTATVADVRRALQQAPGSKDVFITVDGTREGAVVGWVTNSDLARIV